MKERFQAALTTDKLEFECRILRKDGALRWISAQGRVYRDPDGRPVRIMGTLMDITERKQVEGEYQKFVSLVENSTDLIGITFLEGDMLYMNSSGRRLLGFGPDETLRVSLSSISFPRNSIPASQDVALPMVAETGQWEGEVRLRRFLDRRAHRRA